MIWSIAQRVLRENLIGWRFRTYVLGLLALFGISIVGYAGEFLSGRSKTESSARESQRNANLISTQAHIPPNLVGFISSSHAEILPNELPVRAYEIEDHGGRREPQTLNTDQSHIDWLFIIGVWCSLASILFAYDAVSGEKRSQTLRVVFSYPVSRMTFFWGKILGYWMTVVIPLSVVATLAVIVVSLVLQTEIHQTNHITLFATGAATLFIGSVYVLFFILISWLVSSLAGNGATALLGALMVWVAVVWIWPVCCLFGGRALWPIPEHRDVRILWTRAENAISSNINSDSLAAIADAEVSHELKLRMINALEDRVAEEALREQQMGLRQARSMRERFFGQRTSQVEGVLSLLAASPYGQWKLAIDNLATAGYPRYRRFAEQSRDFSADFGLVTDGLKIEKADQASARGRSVYSYNGYSLTLNLGRDYSRVAVDPSRLPKYTWRPPSLADKLSCALPYVAMLLFADMFLLAICLWQFRRIDIT